MKIKPTFGVRSMEEGTGRAGEGDKKKDTLLERGSSKRGRLLYGGKSEILGEKQREWEVLPFLVGRQGGKRMRTKGREEVGT